MLSAMKCTKNIGIIIVDVYVRVMVLYFTLNKAVCMPTVHVIQALHKHLEFCSMPYL